MTLQGTNVVIVGGSTGMGFATAKLAKQQGANITITGRSVEKLAQAKSELGEVRTVAADFSDEAASAQIFDGLDRVDHVFIAAGSLQLGSLLEADISTLRPAFEERIWGPLYVVRSCAPRMPEGGSVTLTSGIRASRPLSGTSIISAACAAGETLAVAMALELAPIRVNAIAPGWIDTPLVASVLGDNRKTVLNSEAAALPVKRIGTPEDIAEAVVMLMNNRFISGEVLHIDGGGRYV